MRLLPIYDFMSGGTALRREGTFLRIYEQIKKFTLLSAELTLEKGEITPTMKIRRKVLEEHYGDVIERIYSS